MTEDNWHDQSVKCFAMMLGNTIEISSNIDQQDDALLVIFNAHKHSINFLLPELNGYWQILIDTSFDNTEIKQEHHKSTSVNISQPALNITEHSCVVLRYLHQTKEVRS